jgi:hypothetical protein
MPDIFVQASIALLICRMIGITLKPTLPKHQSNEGW